MTATVVAGAVLVSGVELRLCKQTAYVSGWRQAIAPPEEVPPDFGYVIGNIDDGFVDWTESLARAASLMGPVDVKNQLSDGLFMDYETMFIWEEKLLRDQFIETPLIQHNVWQITEFLDVPDLALMTNQGDTLEDPLDLAESVVITNS